MLFEGIQMQVLGWIGPVKNVGSGGLVAHVVPYGFRVKFVLNSSQKLRQV
jgi:hypothetical protein